MAESDKKRLLVAGCSGSIGQQTLEVVRQHSDRFTLVGISAHNNIDALTRAQSEFPDAAAALTSGDSKSSGNNWLTSTADLIE